jgi:hypothetical protein
VTRLLDGRHHLERFAMEQAGERISITGRSGGRYVQLSVSSVFGRVPAGQVSEVSAPGRYWRGRPHHELE